MLLHLNEPEWPLSNQFVLKLRLRMARLEIDIVVTVKTFDVICSAFGDYRYKLYVVENFNFKAHFQSKFYRWIIINYKKNHCVTIGINDLNQLLHVCFD